ncbi:MAG TPA: VWA domain-containing protein [Thermoanaerobaculia bacterium]|nr:VWA domain-containing protein [Thermoanaerobaculia bacterium]
MKTRPQRTPGTARTKKGTASLVLGVLGVLGVLSPLAAQPPSFGEVVEVNVVNVDVYVTDANGQPVSGLDKRDFELYEDGKRVEITNFEAVDRAASAGAPAAPAPAPEAAAPESPAASADGLHLVIYVDNFNLHSGNRARAVQQLRKFLAQQLVPGDQVMMATYDLGLNVRLPFTSDPAQIAWALDGMGSLTVQGDEDDRARQQAFREMMTIHEVALKERPPRPCPQNVVTPAHSYASGRRQEVIRTLAALKLLVNSLSGVPGRKAVLHLSDGIALTPGEELFQFLFDFCGGGGVTQGMGSTATVDQPQARVGRGREDEERYENPNAIFDSRLLGPQAYQAASQAALDAKAYSVANEVQALAAHANAHRVTLYMLQANGAQAPVSADASFGPNERLFQMPAVARVERQNRQDTLQALASATGGRAFFDTVNFLPELARMRQDFDRYYSLGYTPAHLGDGREHRIEVKVKQPSLHVRSRQSYRDKPSLERTLDRTLAALFYEVQDNPLEIAVEIGEQIPKGDQFVVPVKLRIPIFKLGILNQQETFNGKLRLFVVTRGPGGLSPLRQVEVPLRIPRAEVLSAMGRHYLYNLSLELPPGEQQIAVAVRDETTTTTSYLARTVSVGAVTRTAEGKP